MNLTITCPSVWSGPRLHLFVRQLYNQFSFFLLLLLLLTSFIWWSSTPPSCPRELHPALLSSSHRSLQSPFSHSLPYFQASTYLQLHHLHFSFRTICLILLPGPHLHLSVCHHHHHLSLFFSPPPALLLHHIHLCSLIDELHLHLMYIVTPSQVFPIPSVPISCHSQIFLSHRPLEHNLNRLTTWMCITSICPSGPFQHSLHLFHLLLFHTCPSVESLQLPPWSWT